MAVPAAEHRFCRFCFGRTLFAIWFVVWGNVVCYVVEHGLARGRTLFVGVCRAVERGLLCSRAGVLAAEVGGAEAPRRARGSLCGQQAWDLAWLDPCVGTLCVLRLLLTSWPDTLGAGVLLCCAVVVRFLVVGWLVLVLQVVAGARRPGPLPGSQRQGHDGWAPSNG